MALSTEELELVNVDALPNTMRNMIKLIGLESTVELVSVYGGTQLRIPNKATKAVVLTAVLDAEKIAKLVEGIGGKRLDVPKLDKVLIQIRNATICKDVATLSISEIAKKHDLTRKTIFTILNSNRHAVEEMQDDLFL